MSTLYYIGIILLLGAFVEWLSPKLGLPKVVGYLSLGLIIGPEVLAVTSLEFVQASHLVTDLALAIIGVLVGATLKFSLLKTHIKEVFFITLTQSIGTFIIVAVGLFLLSDILGLSTLQAAVVALLLAGIATATDTAAPLLLVQEYRAKGSFTTSFLAIIALDDSISLLMFVFSVSIAHVMLSSGSFALADMFHALYAITFSIALGVLAGLLNTQLERLFSHHKGMQTIATLGIIFILFSLSALWHLEPLLSAMVMGVVVTNFSHDFDLIEEEIDGHLTEIIFMLFFIISAMHLKLESLLSLPLAIVAYTVLRGLGKVIGSYVGARLARSNAQVRRYMGLALLPQAGVAMGLALSLQNYELFKSIAPMLLNIVIATTFIHELIGPIFTRLALIKSKECHLN